MEATEKNVSSENGLPAFRKCGYPYCRNMAVATGEYCEMHKHSSLLVKHPGKKNPAKKIAHAPKISKKVKKLVTLVAVKALAAPPELVVIRLTAEEALTASIALALADMINADRFKNADKISGKILKAIVKQIPQHDVEEGS